MQELKIQLKALIIHPYLGSHYKAFLFSAMHKIAEKEETLNLKVLQLYGTEVSRKGMDKKEHSIHQYPFEVLFRSDDKAPSFWARFKKIRKRIKIENPDVINVTGYYDLSVSMNMILAKLLGTRIIMSIDSTLMDHKRSLIKYFFKSFLLYWPDAFFCYGSKSVELIQHYGRQTAAALVIKNAVPNQEIVKIKEDFKSQSTYENWAHKFPENNFLFVGRLIPEKNVAILIEAFENLNLDNWGLIIVGTGSEDKRLRKQSNSPSIFFEGGKNWDEIPRYFNISKALVLPSKSEPWGLVVNESMACGVPVVASDACGAAYDLIDGKNTGLVFESENSEDLEKSLRIMANNKNEADQMGKNALEVIKNYDPQGLAMEMWKGFRKFV